MLEHGYDEDTDVYFIALAKLDEDLNAIVQRNG
jgi:hypothetical protein